ncbi:MAG: hypothetical protein KDE50_24625 [Caldilineaceae bacterium]|nr:hypothetical protein [Caldilineaceae bacterium]
MSTAIVTIPNIEIRLTVAQLITAAQQLEPQERAELVRALADTALDAELAQLIDKLYSQPPIDHISDGDILAEIQAVRLQSV